MSPPWRCWMLDALSLPDLAPCCVRPETWALPAIFAIRRPPMTQPLTHQLSDRLQLQENQVAFERIRQETSTGICSLNFGS